MANKDIQQVDNPGTLFVVATPIGNLEDISRRAVTVLSEVALIAAEDTRRTRSLLAALGVSPPELVALHDHNEQETSRRIIGAMCSGRDVALVSDAGTPLVSDPGYVLIGECYQQGLPVRPVPGASALICALSVCPLPTADFRFLGFLPTRSAARRSRLESLAGSGPLVFFEAPHRVAATLRDIGAVLPGRRVFLGREMTKKFESYLCDYPDALAQRLETQDQYRGEFVCVLEGPVAVESGVSLNSEQTMRVLAKELPPAQAARIGAELLGVNRRQLYDLLQARKGD